ncbi:hypothetical protein NBRC116601_14100 [Cognatishimia sp. WU-CL00825]|uniref:hypothetical protein n=1 Tax=Cognatishimia sp. WU-CL00825 TaxID=3127658 RepID=UPI003102CCEB
MGIVCYQWLSAQSCVFSLIQIGFNMQIPEWTKPALMGAGAGAIALAIVGFNWGGWVTGGSAMQLSKLDSRAAVAMALTPYCVQNSKDDPMSADVMLELDKASSFQRRGVVEKAGWATPLGAEKPDRELADACQKALNKKT